MLNASHTTFVFQPGIFVLQMQLNNLRCVERGGWGDGVLLKTHFDSWICKIGAHLIYASGGSGAFFLFSEQTSHSVVFFLDQHMWQQ